MSNPLPHSCPSLFPSQSGDPAYRQPSLATHPKTARAPQAAVTSLPPLPCVDHSSSTPEFRLTTTASDSRIASRSTATVGDSTSTRITNSLCDDFAIKPITLASHTTSAPPLPSRPTNRDPSKTKNIPSRSIDIKRHLGVSNWHYPHPGTSSSGSQPHDGPLPVAAAGRGLLRRPAVGVRVASRLDKSSCRRCRRRSTSGPVTAHLLALRCQQDSCVLSRLYSLITIR